MKARNIIPKDVLQTVQEPDATYPGNEKNKDATCFQRDKERIVLSPNGVVITTIDLEDD